MISKELAKAIFETEVAKPRFNMQVLYRTIAAASSKSTAWTAYLRLAERLGAKGASRVLQGVIRASFLIELVKTPKIETTKFEVRWTERLDSTDPRRASYDQCFEIYAVLIGDLDRALIERSNVDLLNLFEKNALVPYELPIDYRERRIASPIHDPGNLYWMWDALPRRTINLRAFLRSASIGSESALFSLTYDKIEVKTYRTDRVLTGTHKTNREKRWETHPASVHFALRRSCFEIEHALMSQLCHFSEFPQELYQRVVEADLVARRPVTTRCPVTLEPLSFESFRQGILNPIHGRSEFQVGHLNPLKAVNDDPQSGHTAANVSWLSSDGNRIQGSLSLNETRSLLRRIWENYEEFGIS